MQDIVYKKRKLMAEINVVPYIDVMLVLLIIFMVTAPLLQQGVDVDLPQANTRAMTNQDQEPVIVSVDKAGLYYLNIGEKPGSPVDVATIQKQVAIILKNKPGTPVLVKGDVQVDYGQVVAVMAALQVAGTKKIGLITIPPDHKKQQRR